MRIAYVTAGAAGMYCGSCMRDNTLVAALAARGHDAQLLPIYTPLRTDEDDVSVPRVFFGGINVYLQQKYSLFRHTPWFLDRLLDARGLLRWASRFGVRTQAERLGDLTVSMLRGEHGNQRKEVDKLIGWLAQSKPEIINITNVMLSGIVSELKRRLGVPVLCSLQGDDIYLDYLPDEHRGAAIDLIRHNSAGIDGYITTSRYYADFMAEYLGLPPERIHVVWPGLNLKGHGAPSSNSYAIADMAPCSNMSNPPTTRVRYTSYSRSTCCRCRRSTASQKASISSRPWPTECRSCSRGTVPSPS